MAAACPSSNDVLWTYLALVVLAQYANNSSERLNTLCAAERRVDFIFNSVRGLVAKLLRGERLDHLRRGLGRTSKNDPLQRDEQNPFHFRFPAIGHESTLSEPTT